MDTTKILAILGAASWLPHILTWLYKWLVKPEVIIIPEKIPQIGYTRLGSIFNLRLSLNVSKKDAIIDFVGVNLVHQDGSRRSFEWVGTTEHFSEVRNEKGENQLIQRDLVPIAVKLSPLSLIERFFRFQDSNFIESGREVVRNMSEHFQYMERQNLQCHDSFLGSKKFDDFLIFTRENFWWKAGKYKVFFQVRSPEKITNASSVYEFELTQNDIDLLKINVDKIKDDIENIIKAELPDFKESPVLWIWRNPVLKKCKEQPR